MSAEDTSSSPEILDSNPQMLDSEPPEDVDDSISTDDSAQVQASSISGDQRNALNAHNNPRKSKNLQPLQWDAGLCDAATRWAKQLAAESKFYHSKGSGHGENLFWASRTANPYNDAAGAWMSEAKNYHGQKIGEGNFGSYGHYTQCMWHSTKKVGMGVAKDSKGNVYVVARYSPPGNITGQKPY